MKIMDVFNVLLTDMVPGEEHLDPTMFFVASLTGIFGPMIILFGFIKF